jgi:glucose-6-phosphate-specific signal transduction histidine kinase
MLFLVFFAVLMLAPGVYTAVRVHARHGWMWAALAGIGMTLLGVALLLATVVAFAPLGLVLMVVCLLAALRAYDDGRFTAATAWTTAALLLAAVAGWPR